ncbi:TPA: hypothetical protein EYO12_01660 [Candidatus Saccharibacteria bacterium]|nr:hypothetical protein [Candidatus Saccharibacteria bacterium]HIO87424.1 hypothetical protein [Candidatus Saccharibacteria bacterium]
MQAIEHRVVSIHQDTAQCMQTAAAQLLSFFDPKITVDQVIKEVPVYEENGEKIGTSPGHLAAYFPAQGYGTISYIFDTELFDRSWGSLSAKEVVENLKLRQRHIPENSWLSRYHKVLVDGWELYVAKGGSFEFQNLNTKLLHSLLVDSPIFVTLNSTYLNQESKQLYDQETDKFQPDPIRGRSLTHGVTCTGYKDGDFLIIDPDPPVNQEQRRWVQSDHLIASIMAAQTESDNFLVKISK